MDYKDSIIDALEIMRKKEVASKERFKAAAYAKAINSLRKSGPISSLADVSSATLGIGEKIMKKIKEVIETGSLAAAEQVRSEMAIGAYDAFLSVYGIGPAKARDLIDREGIRSIAALREAVAARPGILNDKQKIGLRVYEDLLERIPRIEMEEHKRILLGSLPKDAVGEIVGSFRRGAENSGDIDILLRGEDVKMFEEYVDTLILSGYITDILAQGDRKCLAVCRLPGSKARRLDILLTPSAEYAYAVLYFTGSADFNVAFRSWALEKGYTLNEHTLTAVRDGIAPVPMMREESDIFRFLGIKWVEPRDRRGVEDVVSAPRLRFKLRTTASTDLVIIDK
jgi:DNA polymerase beta